MLNTTTSVVLGHYADGYIRMTISLLIPLKRYHLPEDKRNYYPLLAKSNSKSFMEAGKERLTRDAVRDATRQEIEQIKRESTDLKHLVADLSLEVYRLKKTAIPPLEDHDGAGV